MRTRRLAATAAGMLPAILLAGLLAGQLPAADAGQPVAQPQRVFICAHSFMIFIAKQLPPMAAAAGVAYEPVGDQMIGGSQVIQHWNKPDDKAKPALREARVDTLILSPTVQVPDQGIENFTRLGVQANPKLRVLVQESWPAFDDAGSVTLEEFQLRAARFAKEQRDQTTLADLETMRTWQREHWSRVLESQIAALNASLGSEVVRTVPVNEAVYELRRRIIAGSMPGLAKQTDVFADAIGHPKAPLQVLVAYCHFAALFGRTPVGLPVPQPIARWKQAAALNRTLQEIAWQAVGASAAAAAGTRH